MLGYESNACVLQAICHGNEEKSVTRGPVLAASPSSSLPISQAIVMEIAKKSSHSEPCFDFDSPSSSLPVPQAIVYSSIEMPKIHVPRSVLLLGHALALILQILRHFTSTP